MNEWQKVRNWGKLRGIDKVESDTQYQRFLQEAVEIHDAMIKDDLHEFKDAIGDTIVTLINLAATKDFNAEDCLEQAFSEIEFRKGITTKKGDFVRYAKLDTYLKNVCDAQQGEPGKDHFTSFYLTPQNFKIRGV